MQIVRLDADHANTHRGVIAFMFENRDQRIDLCTLALLALTIFFALSLVSYSPADPAGDPDSPLSAIYQPDVLVYPQPENISNFCGRAGAFVASLMLTAIGLGSYLLVATLCGVVVFLLLGRRVDSPISRVIGWTMSLVALTTLFSMIGTEHWSGPVIGPGGYLGALGAGLLQQHFANIGSVILALSVFFAGMLLWTDYLVLQILAFVGLKTANKVKHRSRLRKNRAPQRPQSYPDGGPKGVPIRIAGRSVEVDDESEDEFEDEDYESDEFGLEDDEGEYDEEFEPDEDQEEQKELVPTAKKTLRGFIERATPKLRLGKPTDESDEREEVIAQLEEASITEEPVDYDLPDLDMLQESEEFSFENQTKEVRRKARILEKTFKDFGFQVRVVEVETGPVIAQYEIELEAGLRLSRITSLADDMAIALRAPSVRIVAPIPGKNTVGIEVPNEERQTVRLKEVMEESHEIVAKMQIPLFLGKDVSGNALCADLSKLPHLLIAGRTGTGKSVCLNAIISSILMTRRPDEVRMLMIDPKMVELSGYRTLPHLMHPVVTDMRKAEALLAWAVDKMEERYQLLARAGVRHISAYNQLSEEELMESLQPESDDERVSIPLHLPYIVIVADEMADLMMTSGKEVEQHIIRLAQKSRAVGIHLILATQKPTVDVITGLIKSNLPARICFQVASRTDSRVVLDEMGADKLLGNGDMLFLWPGTSMLLRGQGTYMDDHEIKQIVEFVSTGEQNFVNELVHLKVENPEEPGSAAAERNDALYDSAVDVVIREGRGSVSLLQRTLGIGYGRAARMIDWMAEDGIVGSYAGSQAREVLISMEEWEQMQSTSLESDSSGFASASQLLPAPRTNKVLPIGGWDETTMDQETDVPTETPSNTEDEYEDDEDAEDDETESDDYEGEEYETDEYEYDDDEMEATDEDEYLEEETGDYDEEFEEVNSTKSK